MNESDFAEALDKLLADLRVEALKLFNEGIPPEKCVETAHTLLNLKAIGKLRGRDRLAVAPPTTRVRM